MVDFVELLQLIRRELAVICRNKLPFALQLDPRVGMREVPTTSFSFSFPRP
jgi:hypothetical protein